MIIVFIHRRNLSSRIKEQLSCLKLRKTSRQSKSTEVHYSLLVLFWSFFSLGSSFHAKPMVKEEGKRMMMVAEGTETVTQKPTINKVKCVNSAISRVLVRMTTILTDENMQKINYNGLTAITLFVRNLIDLKFWLNDIWSASIYYWLCSQHYIFTEYNHNQKKFNNIL